ncbi:type II CAAX endopeptidase family protein [Streptococcus sp. AM43-2AT]|uniref:CPBP family intramembrane glutamic endopeptidase n=1 Tax=Streptococcus sp. AM43-2AT TaxID=2293247 RepID=UPI000EEFA4C7|nr:type II CAAX endopeptidase family protein [Streptococcus sp. AM43-2AT]RJU24132.1 CPBP family intramembrane metalloprotease [Streptococcus sp. AM43-2AT]
MKYARHGVALLLLLYLFVFGIDGLGIYLTGVFNGDVSFLYFMYLILYSLLLITILFWFKRQKIATCSNKQKWKWSYLAYFALVFLWFFFERWVLQAFQDLLVPVVRQTKLPTSIYLNGLGISATLFFVLATVTSPMIEEFIFRGYLMNVFFKESKFHLDVLLSGFLFAVFHLIHQYRDPITFSLYFCSGLFLAAVYKKHKDIRLPIFLHGFSNFLTFWKPIWIFIFNYIYWHFLV